MKRAKSTREFEVVSFWTVADDLDLKKHEISSGKFGAVVWS